MTTLTQYRQRMLELDFSRFLNKLEPVDSGCWMWTGTRDQYGRFKQAGRSLLAHRVAYEHWVGPIPVGLQVDHLCRQPYCVNPDHLEAVTIGMNVLRGAGITAENARKQHCRQGHALTGDNLYVTPLGRRNCSACRTAARRAYEQRTREKRDANTR